MIAPERVVAIVLAAGSSRRFGDADKLVADYRGRPLVLWAARAAMALPFRAAIGVCQESGPVADLLRKAGLAVELNAAPERGMGSSIAIGVEAARASEPVACLILLGDMPAVTTAHLEALLAAFEGEDDVVISAARGQRSPPTLIGRRHFPTLLTLEGDEGPRMLAARARTVEVADDMLGDINRPEEMGDTIPLGGGRYHFLPRRSFSAELSSIASASSRLSLAFSSSSALSFLASLTSIPPYLAFHL
jgi:molybdenum cofactor cytidylyltransferase